MLPAATPNETLRDTDQEVTQAMSSPPNTAGFRNGFRFKRRVASPSYRKRRTAARSAADGTPAAGSLWRAPLIACAIAALVLIILLLPGVLKFPARDSAVREAEELQRLNAAI